MRDFAAAVASIPNLVRYFKLEESQYVPTIDSGPYAKNGGFQGYPASGTGVQAVSEKNGYLLDQTRRTKSACFIGARGYNVDVRYQLYQSGATDNPNAASFSLMLAGLKPHDMTVNRGWHGIRDNSSVPRGMQVTINTDGSVTVTAGAGTPVSSAAGAIVRFMPHLLIVSYDATAGRITVYCGDWTGRWSTIISAVTAPAISAFPASGYCFAGYDTSATAFADGFLDDLAVYVGHAITSAEATLLRTQAGYAGTGLSYTPSLGHRNMPLNQSYPASTALEVNSDAAVAQVGTVSSQTYANGAGSINYYAYTTAIYPVTAAFRNNPANINPAVMLGPSIYNDFAAKMEYEDCPLPYGGRPSLGFQPSAQTDHHLSIYCAETDEIWDFGGYAANTGTDAAPVWTFPYGGKITQASLNGTAFDSSYLGADAAGIPVIFGVPTIAQLQAAQDDVTPLKQGLAWVAPNINYFVWPAVRHDGSAAPSWPLQEGQLYRLKRDAATTALINAMPYVTGRAMARAVQTYGLMPLDVNTFAGLFAVEDYYQFLTVNGYDPYHKDYVGGPAAGLFNGQTYGWQVMAGFPYSSLQLLDHNAINPGYGGQPVLPAPVISGHISAGGTTRITWQDLGLAQTYNVYRKTGAVYTLLASSQWPEYTLPVADSAGQAYAVTAVNGGGESAYSLPVVPSATIALGDLSVSTDSIAIPLPTVRAAVKRKLKAQV